MGSGLGDLGLVRSRAPGKNNIPMVVATTAKKQHHSYVHIDSRRYAFGLWCSRLRFGAIPCLVVAFNPSNHA